ncbi:hypothetical protein ACET3X_000860 [Alternaria dauci]|uniref:Uncharacterized protein n=1 Tax=Alternaria dauci TaxID=48095 RepID=A0ABR3UWQ9_9PLEO
MQVETVPPTCRTIIPIAQAWRTCKKRSRSYSLGGPFGKDDTVGDITIDSIVSQVNSLPTNSGRTSLAESNINPTDTSLTQEASSGNVMDVSKYYRIAFANSRSRITAASQYPGILRGRLRDLVQLQLAETE